MVAFQLVRDATGKPISFSADLSGIAELGLPADADVIVEPFYKHSAMRFNFGTVGSLTVPKNTLLNEIDIGGEINFRVKVVNNSQGLIGRLVAAGDRFSETTPADPNQGRLSIFPIKPEYIGERIWDVSTSESERPHLMVNIRIPGLKDRILADPLLRGAILVEAFEKILRFMLDTESGDEPEWFEIWKTFVSVRLGLDFPEDSGDDPDEQTKFLDQAKTEFSVKGQFASNAIPADEIAEVADE
jgi:hypothetical protein